MIGWRVWWKCFVAWRFGESSQQPTWPRVFDLLRYLLEDRERVVSKNDLFAHVLGGRRVSDSAVMARLSVTRAAVGDNGATQQVIRTVPRRACTTRWQCSAMITPAAPPGSTVHWR